MANALNLYIHMLKTYDSYRYYRCSFAVIATELWKTRQTSLYSKTYNLSISGICIATFTYFVA